MGVHCSVWQCFENSSQNMCTSHKKQRGEEDRKLIRRANGLEQQQQQRSRRAKKYVVGDDLFWKMCAKRAMPHKRHSHTITHAPDTPFQKRDVRGERGCVCEREREKVL